MEKKNVTIIGSGSFGCALANHLSINNDVKIWSYKEEEATEINENHRCIFLKNSNLNKNIKCFLDFEESLQDSEYVFIVTPSSVFETTIISIKNLLKDNQQLVICSKGIDDNLLFLSEIASKYIKNEIMVLSGPSHAEEVINEMPTKLVIASNTNNYLSEFKKMFDTELIKVEYSNDLIGIQFCNSIKNVVALTNGILIGKGYKDNASSLLITKCLCEISKIVKQLGGIEETVYGITGLGDLIVTCYSENSRNRRAGILISQGKTVTEAQSEIGMVVEGIDNLKLIIDLLNQKNIKSKLFNLINEVVFYNKNIDLLIDEILNI